jgi:hypothetical protein
MSIFRATERVWRPEQKFVWKSTIRAALATRQAIEGIKL